ncbi:T-box transcription factor TBX18-like [Protobothrops mucrosquamatus]|uniref:T-box transcription factor TBX18-like n=1 Tax=Protobothrops mucrosquamatus TaxID=103944 RepID=UPI0007755F13|nr:T-box transcription factor TBX18-like [Protobothrops mucrosquamatus]
MGLEALVESYAFWRPSLRTLTFEDIPGIAKQGNTSSSSLLQGSANGVPSTHPHLLPGSPCSSPAFHLTPNTSQFCSLASADYTACARSGLTLNRYSTSLTETYNRLANQTSETFATPGTPSYVGVPNGSAVNMPVAASLPLHIPMLKRWRGKLAASPEKIVSSQGTFLGSSPSGTMTDRQMLPPVEGVHLFSNGGQQNFFDSRTLGSLTLSSSQVSAHMV